MARYFRTYDDIAEADRAYIAACDLVVRQTADFTNVAGTIETGSARVVGFPTLTGQFLWPFNTRDHPRNNSIPGREGTPGIFVSTLTDGQLLRLGNRMGLAPGAAEERVEEVLDAYMELDYAKLANLDRLMEITRVKMRQAAEITGYDLWHVVERDLRSRPTFLTPLHPAEHVMRALCEMVLPRIGYPISGDAIDDAFLDAYEGDYMFAYGAPLHPSVIRHFGLNVPGDPPEFRFSHEGGITARDFARRVLTLDMRQPVRDVLAGIARGEEPDQVVAALAALAPAQSRNPSYFLQFGNLLLRLGRDEAAVDQFAAGLALAPGNSGLARRLTRALARLPRRKPIVTLQPNERIGFKRDDRGRCLLGEGWNLEIDHDAVWIEGFSASLRFRLPHDLPGSGAAIALRMRPCFADGAMQVRIFANGQEVAHWTCAGRQPDDLRLLALPTDLPAGGDVALSVHVDRPVRPVDLGISRDIRRFGVGLSELIVGRA